MKPRTVLPLILAVELLRGLPAVQSASFQNLGFEAANLPVLPLGVGGGLVPTTDALPGWSAFLGDQPQSEVLHNELLYGSSGISIQGPDNYGSPIEGDFTLLLMAGVDPQDDTTPLSVSVSQFGLVPSDARSVRFKALASPGLGGPSPLLVSAGGEYISTVPLSFDARSTVYGGDISSFAGMSMELRFTAVPFTFGYAFELDAIEFSPEPIPEPGVLVLLGLGVLWFVPRLLQKTQS